MLATLRPLLEEEHTTLSTAYGSGGGGTTEGDGGGLATKYPRSAAIKRIHLILLPHAGEEFKSAVGAYCQRQIIKSVPSLGSDLSSMYLMEEVKPDGQTRYTLAKDPVDVKSHPIHGILVDLVDLVYWSISSISLIPTFHPSHRIIPSLTIRRRRRNNTPISVTLDMVSSCQST